MRNLENAKNMVISWHSACYVNNKLCTNLQDIYDLCMGTNKILERYKRKINHEIAISSI